MTVFRDTTFLAAGPQVNAVVLRLGLSGVHSMAFIKLLPPEGRDALSVKDVLRRLRDEFDVVDADPDAGQDHVAAMIAATLRFSDSLPGKQERLAWLQSIQNDAVFVSFGDDLDLVASCCVQPGSELFFDSPDEIDGPARPLLERAATALGYTVYDPEAEGRRRTSGSS